jgi:arylformamidase
MPMKKGSPVTDLTPPAADAAWLDAQYDNRARVPDHPQHFAQWRADSAQARQRLSRRLDLRYGDSAAETLDLFPAPRRKAPVLVFIHGGYWRAFDKADHSFVAPPFVEAGAMVVVPNYGLCPAVSMETIALQMARAVAWTAQHAALYGGDPAHIVVAGHSAGGQLAAMLLCCDWRVVGLQHDPLRGAVSISGLHDLAPIARVPFLAPDLRLDAAQVQRLSPVGFPPPSSPLHVFVGADESQEYQRQARCIREAWGEAAVPVCTSLAGRNHFSVLQDLSRRDSTLHLSLLSLLGLTMRK